MGFSATCPSSQVAGWHGQNDAPWRMTGPPGTGACQSVEGFPSVLSSSAIEAGAPKLNPPGLAAPPKLFLSSLPLTIQREAKQKLVLCAIEIVAEICVHPICGTSQSCGCGALLCEHF